MATFESSHLRVNRFQENCCEAVVVVFATIVTGAIGGELSELLI